jgi:hypothetical protein
MQYGKPPMDKPPLTQGAAAILRSRPRTPPPGGMRPGMPKPSMPQPVPIDAKRKSPAIRVRK